MPNGGSDCCGTCWFNRANGGERGFRNHDPSVPSYCEIRELSIDNPFYTYCANHPMRRGDEPDPIPLGPVYVHDSRADRRKVAYPSPDTPATRRHALELLADLYAQAAHGAPPIAHLAGTPSVMTKAGWKPTGAAPVEYPLGTPIAGTVIGQLGLFGEPRALPYLDWLAEHDDGGLGRAAASAAAQINARLADAQH